VTAIDNPDSTPSDPVALPANGATAEFGDKVSVYYDGYWIRYYAPPEDSLQEKKALLDSLTRRAFHHTESGINTPGERLGMARKYYETEQDPARKRINAGMLAGALFNRATDIFTTIVGLEERGVHISQQNELMGQCSRCFAEALELGKMVKHYSGEEGVDELWGEPFKVFTMPIAAYFESRYIKIAQTFRDIDIIIDRLDEVFGTSSDLEGLLPLFRSIRSAAIEEVETMRTDEVMFRIWPRFVAAKEAIEDFRPVRMPDASGEDLRTLEDGLRLAHMGKDIIDYLVGVRVPMPKTTRNFLNNCDRYTQTGSLDSEFSCVTPTESQREQDEA
jgi:hypothetical protein